MRIARNIKWDTDGCNDILLPEEMKIPKEIEEDYNAIDDYLSNATGFCHNGYDLDTVTLSLEDVLSITSEHTIVNVIGCDSGQVISRYDGKDSIDSNLNDKEVVMQYIKAVPVSDHLRVAELFIEIRM